MPLSPWDNGYLGLNDLGVNEPEFYIRQSLVMGVDARGFPGGLLRLDPTFAYVEPRSS